MAELYINGFVVTDDCGVISVDETNRKVKLCEANSIPKLVHNFAYDNGSVKGIKDGLGGEMSYIYDASLRIYFTNHKSTLDEAVGSLICKLEGDIETDIRLTGYSEYAITGYCLETFHIGGYDLEREIHSHMGEYMHFILEC